MNSEKKKIILLFILLFKFLIPCIIVPIVLLIFIFRNIENKLLYMGFIMFISGLISFIYKNQLDIVSLIYGILFILSYKLNNIASDNIKLLMGLFIYLSLLIITIIDSIRLIIFKKYKNNKLIKSKNEVEFLHCFVYKLLKRPV